MNHYFASNTILPPILSPGLIAQDTQPIKENLVIYVPKTLPGGCSVRAAFLTATTRIWPDAAQLASLGRLAAIAFSYDICTSQASVSSTR